MIPLTGTTVTCVGVQLAGDLDAWVQAALPFTTEKEHIHARRFTRLIDGVRHLVGRALARRIVCETTLVSRSDFSYTPWGKPFCEQTKIDFSISHSGNSVWVAFNPNGKVGIDVEQIREIPDILRLATVFHPGEYAEIRKQPPAELLATFYRCWVRKEAVLKACGEGLSKPLDSFCVHTDNRKTGWLKSIVAPAAEAWFTHDIPTRGDSLCSVASTPPSTGMTTLFMQSLEQFTAFGLEA